MNKTKNRVTIAALVAFSQAMLLCNTCAADEYFFKVKNRFGFAKNSGTVEDLDSNNYIATGYTSSWTLDKEYYTYSIIPQIGWISDCWDIYAKVQGGYGWLISGREINYPLRWHKHGHLWNINPEIGYLWKICDWFVFAPQIGGTYGETHYKINHQRFSHVSPICFIDQNGTKEITKAWLVYIGFDMNWIGCEWEIGMTYDFGYGGGRGTNVVRRVFITDSAPHTLIGSHVKFEDMIDQYFSVRFARTFCCNWTVELKGEYEVNYAMHALPLKYQDNDELVRAGLFLPSQFHRLNDVIYQSYAILLEFGYKF